MWSCRVILLVPRDMQGYMIWDDHNLSSQPHLFITLPSLLPIRVTLVCIAYIPLRSSPVSI
jgi:hypothetical protein